MSANISRFLKKFIVAMYNRGIRDFPCAGPAYEAGVTAVEKELAEMLPEEELDSLSDAFLLTPVNETHDAFLNWLLGTCCVELSFPYFRNEVAIKNMSRAQMEKIEKEKTPGLSLSYEQCRTLAASFCIAANI